MTDDELTAKLTAIDETLNILVPVFLRYQERIDAVESVVEKLGPAIQKVIDQQREMIAELKAELAVKDAELARLKDDVTMN